MLLEFGTDIIAVIIALVLLVWSADQLVKYASMLASNLGVTPFLIGVIIIGFGTSAPELFVSGLASLEGKGNLAIGNALGSNIANIGLVLGSAALLAAIPLSQRMIKVELPLVFASALIAIALLYDGHLTRLDGLIMSSLLIIYLIWSAVSNRSEGHDDNHDEAETIEQENSCSTLKASLWTLVSLALLIGSSKLLVHGAVNIATALGVSELIIGLTIIAIGTSLPELAASVAAVRQKASSMIIGNIIGSNTFNTLGVLGLTGLVRQTTVDASVIQRDFIVLFLLMACLMFFVYKNRQLNRWQGGVLLTAYFAYLAYLLISSLS